MPGQLSLAGWRDRFAGLIDGYDRGALLLFAGSIAALFVGLFALPWLTRLYSPDAFGNLAVYSALVAAFMPVASLRFELGIGAHRNDAQALGVLVLAVLSALLVSLVLLLLSVSAYWFNPPGIPDTADQRLLLLVPAAVFAGAAGNAAGFWLTRSRHFLGQALTTPLAAIARVILQGTLSGVAALALLGMVVGALATQYLVVGVLFVLVAASLAGGVRMPTARRLRALVRRHAALPRHSFSTSFVNGVASNLLPVVLAFRFGPQIAGVLFLAQQLVATPLALLSQVTWRVAFSTLAHPDCTPASRVARVARLHDDYSRLLAVLLTLPVLLAPEATLLLGPAWGEVSIVMPYVAAMVLMNMLSNVTSYFVIFRRFQSEGAWNIAVVLVKVGAVVVLAAVGLEPHAVIALYCAANVLLYGALNMYWSAVLGLRMRFAVNLFGFALPALGAAALLAAQSWPVSVRLASLALILALLAYSHGILRDHARNASATG